MPHFKLMHSGRPNPHITADEIILSRDEVTGEPEHTLSLHEAREIPEELLEKAQKAASRIGLRVQEWDAPEEESENGQEPGTDAASAGPSVKQTGQSSSEIDQQDAQGRAGQQDTAAAGTGGQAGAATSGTTTGGQPGVSPINPNP